jgi:hypothetical protein
MIGLLEIRSATAPRAARGRGRCGAFLGVWGWLVWAGCVVVLSVVPPGWVLAPVPPHQWSAAAFAGHACEFLVFTLMLWAACGRASPQTTVSARRVNGVPTKARPAGRVVAGVSLAALAFGLLIEIIQLAIPYRSFDLRDWAADAGGIVLALGALSALRRWRGAAPGRRR